MIALLDYFVLIKGIECLGESLMFTNRIYTFFFCILFAQEYLTNHKQWQPITYQPILPFRALVFLYLFKSPRIQIVIHLQTLSSAGKIITLPRYKANHRCCGQSKATPCPTPGIQEKHISIILLCF